MNSKHPYLDPKWIPILKDKVAPVTYDPNKTNEQLVRDLASHARVMELITWLEGIVRNQEKQRG